jgi:hypothetical protein
LTIPYLTNNEDLKLIYKSYNDELDSYYKTIKLQPRDNEAIFKFQKTLFENKLNEFIKLQTPPINEINGGKKNKTKRHMKKRHTKKIKTKKH